MPRHLPIRLAAVCVPALILSVCGVSAASAKTVAASLRVVTTSGKVLAEQTQYTATVKVRTDKKANCFGAGSAGSGKTVRINGPTALGAVVDGAAVNPGLRPVSLTDAFDFGLGVCGFGGSEPSTKGFWYLKSNHVGAQVGGDLLRVRNGDDLLWYLSPSFTGPDELSLVAPSFVKRGTPFTVQVFSYDEKGKKKPAKGANVPGADLPTGANGKTSVVINDVTKLTATAKGLIPSNSATVCIRGVGTKLCTHSAIDGSGEDDVIKGTGRTDNIKAGAGDDRVDARDGGGTIDRVDCGSGKDTVLLDKGDKAVHCEVKTFS